MIDFAKYGPTKPFPRRPDHPVLSCSEPDEEEVVQYLAALKDYIPHEQAWKDAVARWHAEGAAKARQFRLDVLASLDMSGDPEARWIADEVEAALGSPPASYMSDTWMRMFYNVVGLCVRALRAK